MLLLTIIGLLVGALLGLRYTVTALIPAIAAVIFGSTTFGTATGDSAWTVALTIAACTTALQLGYLAGAILREATAEPRGADVLAAVAQRPPIQN